jgi:hypothetical protein
VENVMGTMFGDFVMRAREILAVYTERMYKRARNKRMSNLSLSLKYNSKDGIKQRAKQTKP